MANTYVVASTNARLKAVQRMRVDDPTAYNAPKNKRIDAKFTVVGQGNELANVIDSESVGKRVMVKNATGGTLNAGTLVYLGAASLSTQTTATASNNPIAGANVVINVTGSWEVGQTVSIVDAGGTQYGVLTAVNGGAGTITVDMLFYSATTPVVTALPAYSLSTADQTGQNHAEWVIPTGGIANNAYGYAYDNAEVTGLDTHLLTVGNLVYLSTAGTYTATAPTTGTVQVVGVVKVVNASTGAILFFPGNKRILSAGTAAITPGTSAQVLMSNATPSTTWTTISGDVTTSATGVFTIGANKVTAAKIGSGVATANQVLTADGAGNSSWQNASAAAASGIVAYVTKNANYTAVAGDKGTVFSVTAGGGGVTIALTAAATLGAGWYCWIEKADNAAGSVVVDPNAAELIDGQATLAIGLQYQSAMICCTGTEFLIVSSDLAQGTAGQIHLSPGIGTLAQFKTMSGDATIAATGVITIANLAVTNAKIAAATIDLTAKVTGILPTANGGTGIAFFTAAGPTVARTYTFPDSNQTVGCLGVAQTWSLLNTYTVGVAFTAITPAQITSDQNNYAPGASAYLRLSSDATRNITGIVSQPAGSFLIIANVGSSPIILANQSASSTAANRIISPNGNDITLSANYCANLIYDGTQSRWQIVNFFGSSGTGTVTSVTGSTNINVVNGTTTPVISITGQIPVTNGGTGVASTTAYGVVCGGTSSTGNFQNAGAGTVGQWLTSGGASALPSYGTVNGYGTHASRPGAASGNTNYRYFETDTLTMFQSDGANWNDVGFVDPGVCEGRLTLTSVTPVTTADVTGATTIYFTPYKGCRVSIYNGTIWKMYKLSEISVALGTLTNALPYDVFVYDNAGTVTLEVLAWSNTSTRATALVLQDGVLCKTGALTRRYLGSFYTTATTTTEDSAAKRFLFNMYNRVERTMVVLDTNSTAASSATTSFAEVNSADEIQFLIGWQDCIVKVGIAVSSTNSSATGDNSVGIGLDSTTVNSATVSNGGNPAVAANGITTQQANYEGYPVVGKHFCAWLVKTNTGTGTWYGTAGLAWNTGLHGTIEA